MVSSFSESKYIFTSVNNPLFSTKLTDGLINVTFLSRNIANHNPWQFFETVLKSYLVLPLFCISNPFLISTRIVVTLGINCFLKIIFDNFCCIRSDVLKISLGVITRLLRQYLIGCVKKFVKNFVVVIGHCDW